MTFDASLDEIYADPLVGPVRLMQLGQRWTASQMAGIQLTPRPDGGMLAVIPSSPDPADWPRAAACMLDIRMPDWPVRLDGTTMDAHLQEYARTMFRLQCGLPRGLKTAVVSNVAEMGVWDAFADLADLCEDGE